MRTYGVALAAAVLAVCAASPAQAQTQAIDRTVTTQADLQSLVDEIGPALRFRQLGDTNTVRAGDVEVGVQYGNEIPGFGARFGLGDRVDLGAWGGVMADGHSGVVGVDTKVVLLREGPSMPVSMAVRPSLSGLLGDPDAWLATFGVDLSVSRMFGAWSPYAGFAASTSAAYARSSALHLDSATGGDTYAYAGLSFRWRALVLAGEVDNARDVTYAFRIGTRF